MRYVTCFLVFSALLASWASPAGAQVGVSRVQVRQVDNGGMGDLAGTVTNELLIDFLGILSNQHLELQLSEGNIYQHPQGTNVPPDPSLFTTYPNLRFDTFLAMGGADADTSAIVGEPVALPNRFESDFVDASWNDKSPLVLQGMDFLTARITLSGDAQGTWLYRTGTFNPTVAVYLGGVIENGAMIVPEPTSLLLVLYAILFFFRYGCRPAWRRGLASGKAC